MTNVSQFNEENLTVYQHMDADKHWIGESLPPPSVDEVQYAGVKTAVGESPFPARADHSHDVRTRQTYISTIVAKSCPASSSTYITGFITNGGWENFLHPASTQLIDFPVEGVYIINNRVTIQRSSGAFPASTLYTIRFDYFNIAWIHPVEIGLLPTGLGAFASTITEIISFASIDGSQNLQFLYQNNDTVAHNVNMQVVIQRTASSIGAESD